MNTFNLDKINTTEKIDELMQSIIDGTVHFSDAESLKISMIMKIRKIKLQLYFLKLFEQYKNNLTIVQHIKPKKYKENDPNKQIKNKLVAKGKTTISQRTKKSKPKKKKDKITKKISINTSKRNTVLNFESINNKTIEEAANYVRQTPKRLITVLKKKSGNLSNLSDHTIIDENLWILCCDFLQTSYKLKISHEKREQNSFVSLQKKRKKFKPYKGRPGNYGKLIYTPTRS